MDLGGGGGGRNKDFRPFGGRKFYYGQTYTKIQENRHLIAKMLKIERFFERLLD